MHCRLQVDDMSDSKHTFGTLEILVSLVNESNVVVWIGENDCLSFNN